MKIDLNKGSQALLTEMMNESLLAQKRKSEDDIINELEEAKKAKVEPPE